MDLSKSFEFFDPTSVDAKIHIIGCGSVGSSLAEMLARLGLANFVLYDFDTVEAHNLANQQFTVKDIGRPKVEATADIITSINPEAAPTIQLCPEGYNGQRLTGYVFLAVDNIDLRREICEKNKMNRAIKAVFDFRTRLVDAQHYAADWRDMRQINNIIASMQFSHEEAHEATPKTACGRELGVAATVRTVVCLGVSNFINFIKGSKLKNIIVCNPFEADIY